MDLDSETSQRKGSQSDNVHFKLLVPSVAAGAIIGKGGEAIAQVQKDHGAKVKMSKANDFYPGTTERVCLIQGSLESVRTVCDYVMERILEKPDPNPRVAGDGKLNVERHKQVKILVPNSTAGMVIGKKGAHIKEIMEASGAYVQISQKPKEQALSERCVTIAGDPESNRSAVGLILTKVAEDPQSGSCPGISYAGVSGPVASAYPTGSPYAAGSDGGLSTPSGAGGFGGGFGRSQAQGTVSLSSSQSSFTSISVEALRASLRASGYSDAATEDIVSAMLTLANYGFFNLQSLLPGHSAASAVPLVASPHSSLSLPPGSLSAMATLNDAAAKVPPPPHPPPPPPPHPSQAAGAEFGAFAADPGAFMFQGSAPPPPLPQLFDSFASSSQAAAADVADKAQGVCKRELEILEPLIGVVIGPAGKDIAELQSATQTSIQVSKRGDHPARTRVVSITGLQGDVAKAAQLIQQRVQQEELRRQHAGGGQQQQQQRQQ